MPHLPMARPIACGQGWALNEFICQAGPEDRPFEEMHDAFTIALVAEGSFNYRSETGHVLLHAGSMLLGNWGQCFSCGHSHSRGDRCLALQVQPSLFMEIAATHAGAIAFRFPVGMLPATLAAVPLEIELMERREVLAGDVGGMQREESMMRFVANVLQYVSGVPNAASQVSALDEKRISRVFQYLDAACFEAQSLEDLAEVAAMSKFHFVRTFKQVAGVTPYRYVLGRRLVRVAHRLRTTMAPVSEIAFSEGFGDLSTFNRQFREVFAISPSAYRRNFIA